MKITVKGKGFSLKNLDRNLQTEISGKLQNMQIPILNPDARQLFKVIWLPLNILPVLVDQLPAGGAKVILQQLMRTNLDLITGRRNLEFDEGSFLLKGDGSNIEIKNFQMKGPMVFLKVEKGILNPFYQFLDVYTESNFSGVVLPFHLTGDMEQPEVDTSLFLPEFLSKNSQNLLSTTLKLLTLGMLEQPSVSEDVPESEKKNGIDPETGTGINSATESLSVP